MNSLTVNNVRNFLLNRYSGRLAARGLDPSGIGENFDLLASGIVEDSLGLMEMISAVEQHFNITVDFESMDPAELSVLGPFSHYVAAKAKGQTAG